MSAEIIADTEVSSVYLKRGEFKKALEISSRGNTVEDMIIKAKCMMALGDNYNAVDVWRYVAINYPEKTAWARACQGVCYYNLFDYAQAFVCLTDAQERGFRARRLNEIMSKVRSCLRLKVDG